MFPSRRSALYFQKYLGQCSAVPVFSPDIVTIGDLMGKLSPWRTTDKIELIYILYQHYCRVAKANGMKEVESFDTFVNWGETLIADFNDVDKYLIPHDRLFANIRDLRNLDSFFTDFMTPEQIEAVRKFWGVVLNAADKGKTEYFVKTWQLLEPLYTSFKEDLAARGIAYDGMNYREVAERIKAGNTQEMESYLSRYRQVVVIGQNALSECEKCLYDYLMKAHNGDFYWDFYYERLKDPKNKASLFISDYIGRYPGRFTIEAETVSEPEIEFVAVSSGVGQAKVAARYLSGMTREQLDGTAVVLPDEQLLLPMLNSIPENVREVNVTMGYGLSGSGLASLFTMLGNLQTRRRNGCFYHKDVFAILAHPIVKGMAGEETAALRGEMLQSNVTYLGARHFDSELLARIFAPVETAEETYLWQLGILDMVAVNRPPVEQEFAHGFYKVISRIRDLAIPMEQRTYFHFLGEMTSSIEVSFRGEPLRGLQIMGPLEVRAIDFETLIVLSVNEGVFPSASRSYSVIPYNLRRGYGLPTSELFDSISAYHFYRSIYRASKVILIYDSRTRGIRSGEESRFIKQLDYGYGLHIERKTAELQIKPIEGVVSRIDKTSDVLDKMKRLFFEGVPKNIDGEEKMIRKPFSASMLLDYLKCPLMFYYKWIEELSEEEEISEGVEASEMGTVFHDSMQDLYDNMTASGDKDITAAKLDGFINDKTAILGIVAANMRKVMKMDGNARLSSRNSITCEVIADMVHQTLCRDREMVPFEYVASEKSILREINLSLGEDEYKALFKGKIDRIDKMDGHRRICDYKTGSV